MSEPEEPTNLGALKLGSTEDVIDAMVRGFVGTILWVLMLIFGRGGRKGGMSLNGLVMNWFGQSTFQWMVTKLANWLNIDDQFKEWLGKTI